MDAGIVEKEPYRNGRDDVEDGALLPHPVEKISDEDHQPGDEEEVHIDISAIEECDHQYCAEVIRHGKCGQEHFQRDRDLVAHHGENHHGECDICGRRYSPARGSRRPAVEQCEYEGRHHHSPEGGNYRKYRLPERRKLAYKHFPLDFETHGEEEQHHQYVIDEFLYGKVFREYPVNGPVPDHVGRTLDGHGEARAQEGLIIIPREWEIGEEHCNDYA